MLFCSLFISFLKLDHLSSSHQIDCFEARFCDLSGSLYAELCDKDFKPRDVTRLIFSLPLGVNREVSGVISPNASGIGRKEDIHQLFEYLNRFLWNFIDYNLLEYIVTKVGSSNLKHSMAQYVKDISEFRQNITVSDLIECWKGRKECPENFCQVQIKVDMHPKECTLEHLNSLRISLCERYLPPLSEYALIHYKFEESSILLTWLISTELALVLIKRLNSSEESCTFFLNNRITMFSVGKVNLYPNSSGSSQHERKCQGIILIHGILAILSSYYNRKTVCNN